MFVDQLAELRACAEAKQWVGSKTLAQAWRECPRGDWLLWLAARAGVDRRLIVEAACRCAEAVIGLVPEGEERPIRAIEVARAWIRGEATIEEVRAAARASKDTATTAANAAAYYTATTAANAAYYAAANAAYYAAAADAEYAAFYAANAAANAAYYAAAADAEYAAFYAARDAANAAANAAFHAARTEAQQACADLVRQVITARDVAEALRLLAHVDLGPDLDGRVLL